MKFYDLLRGGFSDDLISASLALDALKSGDFDKLKNRVPDATIAYLREQRTEFLRRFTARVDIKFLSTEGDFQVVSVSDDKNTTVLKPAWLQNNGIGYQIESRAGKLELVVKSVTEGQISILLRGIDVRTAEDKDTRIPYWIDYTRLTINDKTIFNRRTPAWHGKFYRHIMNVDADEEITIQIEWLPHNG